jgi:rhodanese-related sulfurtransferase
MDRLLEYCAHHFYEAALALIAAVAVLGYELRLRMQNAGALAPQEVIRLMNQGATVLDLRAADAYAAGHINGARHFDPGQIASAAEALKKYKERPLIVYCDRGSTAPSAVRTLVQQGFTKVFNLRGGLAAWRAENLPLARGS